MGRCGSCSSLELCHLSGEGYYSWGNQGLVAFPIAVPGPPPSTWHRDPGEGLRLAQRVHLDVPERLAHGALQVPATQEDAGEPLRPLGG